jgi:F-type H+-transporting ATPase subunit c
MEELGYIIHFSTIGLSIGVSSLSAGIGEGIAGYAAIKASNRQPQAHHEIMRMALIGTALIETIAILGLFISSMLFVEGPGSYDQCVAQIGIIFAFCIASGVAGIMATLPLQEAANAIARQPFFAQKILGFVVITQALIQTPVIASFVIVLIMHKQIATVVCFADAIRIIASGLCIGVSSIGPTIGLALYAKAACQAIGMQRDLYRSIFSFTLISQTLIETPIVFAFLISLMMLLFVPPLTPEQTMGSVAMMAAAWSTGLGTLGTGIGSGITAAAACKAIAANPTAQAVIGRSSLFAQALIETCTIYAVLVSIALIIIWSYV